MPIEGEDIEVLNDDDGARTRHISAARRLVEMSAGVLSDRIVAINGLRQDDACAADRSVAATHDGKGGGNVGERVSP